MKGSLGWAGDVNDDVDSACDGLAVEYNTSKLMTTTSDRGRDRRAG